MKPLPILFSACVLGVTGGVITNVAMQPGVDSAAPAQVGDSELDVLRARDRELTELVGQLSTEIRELSALTREAPASSTRVPEHDLDAVVQRYMEQHHPELAMMAASAPEASGVVNEVDVKALAAELDALGSYDDEAQAIWERAREAGKVDELVALFEARAEQRPDDPDAQLDVGEAYLQKIFEVGDGPEKGMWATRADQAFDRALDLDPRHWDARFTKAVSLSFWPPLFGKQAEAVRNFEVLIEQQQSGPIEPQYAQTYELLGNLYQQSGQADKARETWQAGAQLFPDSDSLLEKANQDL